MSKNILLTTIIILLLVIAVFVVAKYVVKGDGLLISPRVGKITSQSTPVPTTPSYNPPKEIKYDISTNLKQELDSVNPEVLESDFKDI